MKESDILYETASHWVKQSPTGYEVYRIECTHSVRCARIGWPNSEKGLKRAIKEADKRSSNDISHDTDREMIGNDADFLENIGNK